MVEKTDNDGVRLEIVRKNPDGISPVFVNDMILTHTADEFYLVFSQIEPPVVQTEEQLQKINDIPATNKVKLILTPNFMEKIVKVMTDNLEKHKKSHGDK